MTVKGYKPNAHKYNVILEGSDGRVYKSSLSIVLSNLNTPELVR